MTPTGQVLITGGTGTLGHAILDQALQEGWDARFTVYSRSEFLQAQMRAAYPHVRFLLGDVRDRERLTAALAGHDTVLHLAAMKRLPECEAQPSECMQTNVIGTHNVVQACIAAGVRRCVLTSTDKACASISTYGASKRMAEGLIQGAPLAPTTFTAVRYGNVLGSRGSVIPIWEEQAMHGEPLTITDARMTRFWMSAQDAVALVCYALTLPAGTIAVPKMGALGIVEMAQMAIPGVHQFRETGLRSLEKLHEDLVHAHEQAIETDTHYLLRPTGGEMGYTYRSDTARQLTPDELLTMLDLEAVPV
jgi:UDP-N-acetylglucosamine 4,6-dehydratase